MSNITKILKIKGDWQEVVNDCRATVGKGELGKEPSTVFKRGILIAEHAPIRDIIIKWIWNPIASFVATHWSRHKWECYVRTQRTDRTGINRNDLPQDAPVTFTGEANPQHLIDTWRKRLCYQAAAETREKAVDFKVTLKATEPEISDVLVPNCVYRCGCPELTQCGAWEAFVAYCNNNGYDVGHLPIQARYDLYNEWFYDMEANHENEHHA